jgi:CheY-like chemotaxis protein
MTSPTDQPPLRERPRILIIDDQSDLTRFCRRVMGDLYQFEQVTNGKAADAALAEGSVAATLVDRDFSRGDRQGLIGPAEDICNEGIHIVRWIRRNYPHVPSLMVTGYREQRPALEMAELGGDFLAWQDVIDDRIFRACQRALERHGNRARHHCRFRESHVVESPSLPRFALHEASLTEADPPDR